MDTGYDERPLHEQLTDYLSRTNVKQTTIAERSGWTTFAVNRLLKGRTKITLDGMEAVADAARMPPVERDRMYFPSELQSEAQGYEKRSELRESLPMRLRVDPILSRIPSDAKSTIMLAAEQVNWSVSAAAYLAWTAYRADPSCLPEALYLYGGALQDCNQPHRAKAVLEAARRLAEERGGAADSLYPFLALSLANLAVESGRVPEGIGLFQDIRERFEIGLLPLGDRRQIAHLYGFSAEARVLRAIDLLHVGAAATGPIGMNTRFEQEKDDLLRAIAATDGTDRPHWCYRFHATHGLVLVLRGDVDTGLDEIQKSVTWFAKSDRLPADCDSGAYILTVQALAQRLGGGEISDSAQKGLKEAERLAIRDGTFVVLRMIKLLGRVAPILFAILLALMLVAPSIALAGNRC